MRAPPHGGAFCCIKKDSPAYTRESEELIQFELVGSLLQALHNGIDDGIGGDGSASHGVNSNGVAGNDGSGHRSDGSIGDASGLGVVKSGFFCKQGVIPLC